MSSSWVNSRADVILDHLLTTPHSLPLNLLLPAWHTEDGNGDDDDDDEDDDDDDDDDRDWFLYTFGGYALCKPLVTFYEAVANILEHIEAEEQVGDSTYE